MPDRIRPRVPVRVYLAAWREHLGLTQQQVGDRINGGVEKGTVSRWETTKRVPSINVIAAYAEALRIPTSYLFRRPETRASLDEIMADASDELKNKAEEMLRILVRTGTTNALTNSGPPDRPLAPVGARRIGS